MILEVLSVLVGLAIVGACLFSLGRDRSADDEPATLEGGSSHMREPR